MPDNEVSFREWLNIVRDLGLEVRIVRARHDEEDEQLPPLAFACSGEACTGEREDGQY